MTQIFEETILTSDHIPESKQSVESIVREWFISQIKGNSYPFLNCGNHDQSVILNTIRRIIELSDEGSFKIKDVNFNLLTLIAEDIKNDNPLYPLLLNNRYTFSINGVALRYDPAATGELKCQIIV
jgi:hypothetical protein